MPSLKFIMKLVVVGACIVFTLFPLHLLRRSERYGCPNIPIPTVKPPAIAKISVIYGEYNEWYERAVSTHERHAERHGYPCHVLRNPVAPGEGHHGYWNKMLYLQSMLVQELGKKEGLRAQWLMWFDAYSIIINQEIPLEIFLPPADYAHIHFLVTRDQHGLNSGVFFLRVHPCSIALTTKVIGFPIFKPEIDLGFSADQQAMALVLREPEFQSHTVWQPRLWYNSYQQSTGFEGKKGDLLVHFPGLEDRWTQMSMWLNFVSHPKAAEWQASLDQTAYLADVDRFWSLLRRTNTTLNMVEAFIGKNHDSGGALVSATERLERMRVQDTDSLETMETAIQAIWTAMELQEPETR